MALKTFGIDKFVGLDTRPGLYSESTPALVTAENLSLVTGGAIQTRSAFVKEVDLHSESVGLYARGGILRSVVPGGHSIQDSQPAEVMYDPIGAGSAYALGKLQRLIAAETFDTSPVFGPNGYVAVLRNDGRIEHHYITDLPAVTSAAVNTYVSLPFAAGMALTKLEGHMWAPAPLEGSIHFSSAVNGADDWTSPGDAGFLPTGSHVSGARDVLTVHHHRGRLAAFFYDAVQLWRVFTDPTRNELEQVLVGPGAISAGSVANVLGDVYYLGRGGFRSLNTATVTGESNENDIGSTIRSLTDGIATGTFGVALWSQTRSQYLCAIGNTVYAFTHYPDNTRGWTTWTLPTSIDYLVENNGTLWARSGTVLYRFDDSQADDYDGSPLTATLETRPMSLGVPGRLKTLHFLTVRQTTEATWTLIVDGLPLKPKLLPACSPKSLRIPIAGEGRQIAIRVSAPAGWRLEGLTLDFEPQAF